MFEVKNSPFFLDKCKFIKNLYGDTTKYLYNIYLILISNNLL